MNSSPQAPNAGGDRQLFRDLRNRNERRARFARLIEAQREYRLTVDRVVQEQRERRFRKTG